MNDQYFEFLLDQIKSREENLAILRKFVTAQDPNYRLEQGYLNCLVKVVKDLAHILGKPLDEEFYPDFCGLLEEDEEEQ